MKNIDDLLDAVKKVSGSDYKTAREIDVVNQLIGNWRGRRGMPSNKHVMLMCEFAKLDLGEAIRAVEYSRENERPLREAGFIDVSLLSSMGGLSLLGVTYPIETAIFGAVAGSVYAALYIMRSKVIITKPLS